jgi:hypothetical protein
MSSLDKAYDSFHGHRARFKAKVSFTPPKGFVLLGQAVAVEYRTDKLNGGGDGKMAVYRHKFDKGAILLMDQSKKRQLYIMGDRIKVTDAGIEH